MRSANFRLLFHHHDIAYRSQSGGIWLTAGIGRWISALAVHFQEVRLLLHESDSLLKKHDYQVTEPNVKLVSLGTPGHYVDYLTRMKRIRQVCQEAGNQADGLLIRGLTPRQYSVWRHTPVLHKAFFLVRSPRQNRLTGLSPLTVLSAIVNKCREHDFERIIHNSTLMIANSPLHVKELKDIYSTSAYFIPTSTIRSNEFSSLQVRSLNDPIRLFFCGRLHALKGIRELFAAMAILHQQGISCTLDIAAELNEPSCLEFQRLSQNLGIASSLRWHGYVPFGEKLLDLYRSSDIFVLPTYTEGFPRVIWEATANCCPVISTSVGGIPALITHGEHALLISPKDAEALAAAVKCLILDNGLRKHLIEQAYQLAQGFSVESCAQKMVSLLETEWE